MISEKALKEINKALHIGDVMLRFKLRLNIDEWGNYKKGDEDTFYIKLLDEQNGLAKFAIDKQWDIVSCEFVNKDLYSYLEEKELININNWGKIVSNSNRIHPFNADVYFNPKLLESKFKAYQDYINYMTEKKAILFAGFKSKDEFKKALMLHKQTNVVPCNDCLKKLKD